MFDMEHQDEDNARDQFDIVRTGIDFMSELFRYYGQERGGEIWTAVTNAVPAEIKDSILMSLLVGERSGYIRVRAMPGFSDRVAAIKAIRTYDTRSFGLKDAKDLVDALCPWDGKPPMVKEIRLQVYPAKYDECLIALRKAGLDRV